MNREISGNGKVDQVLCVGVISRNRHRLKMFQFNDFSGHFRDGLHIYGRD